MKNIMLIAMLALGVTVSFVSCSKKSNTPSVITADTIDDNTYTIASIDYSSTSAAYDLKDYLFGQDGQQSGHKYYLETHVSDPAKNRVVTSQLYMVNVNGYLKSFSISKTNSATSVSVNFDGKVSYTTCSEKYPSQDLTDAGIMRIVSQISVPVTPQTGNTTGTYQTQFCYGMDMSSLNGTYSIKGEADAPILEMVNPQGGPSITIRLQKN